MTLSARTRQTQRLIGRWGQLIFIFALFVTVDPVIGKHSEGVAKRKSNRRGEQRRLAHEGHEEKTKAPNPAKDKLTKSPSWKDTKAPSWKDTKSPSWKDKETKAPNWKVKETKAPSSSPSTSPIPTFRPTVSFQPSTTVSPSASPSQSHAPTGSHSPTTFPTTAEPTSPPPTEEPTTPPPTVSPTVSLAPTGSPKPSISSSPTSPAVTITRTSTSVEYACQTTTPPAGYSAVQFQLFEFQADLCIDTTVTDMEELGTSSEAMLANEIAPGLAARHVDCEPGDKYEFLGVVFDSTRDKGFLEVQASTGTDKRCYQLRDASIQMNFAERLSSRQLNLVETLSNSEVAELFLLSIRALYSGIVFPNTDYPGVLSANVTGLSNYGSGGVTTTGETSSEDGQKANSLVSNEDDNGGSSGPASWIPALFVVCAVLLVVVVAVIAVKKRRSNDVENVSHVMLKDVDDDDYLAGTPYGKQPLGSGAILKDLAPGEDFEEDTTEDDSLDVSHVDYPQVYVMGDGDDTVADEDEEVRYTAGAYWAGGQSVAPGPTFVTTDLKKAMRDLEPPAPTPQKARGYIHDDTVDL